MLSAPQPGHSLSFCRPTGVPGRHDWSPTDVLDCEPIYSVFLRVSKGGRSEARSACVGSVDS
jgi:hypothetical protein